MRIVSSKHQMGVALIKAMLVVALATSVAVAMVSRQQFDIRRTGNLLQAGQIALYADGVDSWAAQVLRRDFQNNKFDHTEEDWATILPPIPVEGGSVGGHIEDLQGRFNLNSLVESGKRDDKAVTRFRRLLVALGLNQDLATVVVDWIDSDYEAGFPAGAEDDLYMRRDRPYRTANAPMVSPSELLLLEGVDAETYTALKPYVAVLPSSAKINVNTASVPVLMSLSDGLSIADAEELITTRAETPYEKLDDFLQQNSLAGQEIDMDALSVNSEYFLVVSSVQFGAISQQRHSVLQRDTNGASRIMMRAQGTY